MTVELLIVRVKGTDIHRIGTCTTSYESSIKRLKFLHGNIRPDLDFELVERFPLRNGDPAKGLSMREAISSFLINNPEDRGLWSCYYWYEIPSFEVQSVFLKIKEIWFKPAMSKRKKLE